MTPAEYQSQLEGSVYLSGPQMAVLFVLVLVIGMIGGYFLRRDL
jgi:hypothetical protein